MRGRSSRLLCKRWLLAVACLLTAASCAPEPSPVETVTPPTAAGMNRATDPALLATQDGTALLSWVGGDSSEWRLYLARSHDGGATWSDPIAITPPGEPIHPHGEASPRLIAASGGRVAAVWTTSRDVPGRQWPASDVRFARSLDGGRTWSAPVTLNDDSLSAPAGHTFHGATIVGDSAIVVAWLDERPTLTAAEADSESVQDASLYGVRSDDFGAGWQANLPMAPRVCPCCRVQLASHAGELVAAWRKHYPGHVRDVVVASLGNPPARVSTDGWEFAGCPHTGPAIAVDGSGARHIAWFTGAKGRTGVHYRRWTGDPDSSSAPVPVHVGEGLSTAHVSMATSADNAAVVAFDLAPDGKRGVTIAEIDVSGGSLRRSTHVPGSDGALYPQVALLAGDRALVTWSKPETNGTQSLGLARLRLGR